MYHPQDAPSAPVADRNTWNRVCHCAASSVVCFYKLRVLFQAPPRRARLLGSVISCGLTRRVGKCDSLVTPATRKQILAQTSCNTVGKKTRIKVEFFITPCLSVFLEKTCDVLIPFWPRRRREARGRGSAGGEYDEEFEEEERVLRSHGGARAWSLDDGPFKLVLIVNMQLKMGKGKASVCS